jgi:hypothetical protein
MTSKPGDMSNRSENWLFVELHIFPPNHKTQDSRQGEESHFAGVVSNSRVQER